MKEALNIMPTLLDGRALADDILYKLRNTIANIHGTPKLAIINVGENKASEIYIRTKKDKARELGIKTSVFELPAMSSTVDILRLIDTLNAEKTVNGILVQAPLPVHEMQSRIFENISPEKDVDGFNSINLGKLFNDDWNGFVPCTPLGIIELLAHYNIEISGKHVVIIGRSTIVGKPLAVALMKKSEKCNATVTVCNSKTEHLQGIVKTGDIVVAAIGSPHIVTEHMIKPGAVVVDVGINRIDDSTSMRGYRIVGDVDFDNVSKICSAITPVPGGVGPMTVAMLMKNTVKAYINQQ